LQFNEACDRIGIIVRSPSARFVSRWKSLRSAMWRRARRKSQMLFAALLGGQLLRKRPCHPLLRRYLLAVGVMALAK